MKKYITWNDVDKFVETISTKYKNKINGVYGLPRGGLTLAVMISNVMDIPMLASPCKGCLIVDDICSAGGTFKFSAIKLKEMGASDVFLYISHCEDNIQNGDLLKTDLISKIYTTDSILHISNPKIQIIKTFRV